MKAVQAKWLVCSHDSVLSDCGLLYDGGKITEILPNSAIDVLYAGGQIESVLGGAESIVCPGFVNAHTHQYGVLSHGIPCNAEFTDFEGFLKAYWWPSVEDRITGREVLATTLFTSAEMLQSGVTAFCDTLEAPFAEDDVLCRQADLIESVGLRAIVSLESSQRVSFENGRRCLEQNRRAVQYARRQLKKVAGAICTHTTFTCTPDFICEAATLAKEEGALFQFHLSESDYESSINPRPTDIYRQCGALGHQTLASQCVVLDQQEIDWLRESGTRVVHMPLSNCEVGGGFAPIPDMLASGIPVALGSDGYINDFFTVMKGAFLLHKANCKRTDVMPAEQVFRMATELGATSLGLQACGVLKKGYCADFMVLDDTFPTPVTRQNIYDQIVVHGDKEKVRDVVVGGDVLLREGKTTTMDQRAAQEQLRVVATQFWASL